MQVSDGQLEMLRGNAVTVVVSLVEIMQSHLSEITEFLNTEFPNLGMAEQLKKAVDTDSTTRASEIDSLDTISDVTKSLNASLDAYIKNWERKHQTVSEQNKLLVEERTQMDRTAEDLRRTSKSVSTEIERAISKLDAERQTKKTMKDSNQSLTAEIRNAKESLRLQEETRVKLSQAFQKLKLSLVKLAAEQGGTPKKEALVALIKQALTDAKSEHERKRSAPDPPTMEDILPPPPPPDDIPPPPMSSTDIPPPPSTTSSSRSGRRLKRSASSEDLVDSTFAR